MVWQNYHSGGEGAPRVDLVYAGTVQQSISLANVAAAALDPTAYRPAKLFGEQFVQDVELRKKITGAKDPIRGGFYYQAKVELPWVDKTYGGVANAIINHCATPGDYYAEFYPHEDVVAIHFKVFIDGHVGPFKYSDREYNFGHSAELIIYGLEPIQHVPWKEEHLIQVLQTGVVYPAGELVHTQIATPGVAYTTAELQSDIGQVLKENNVYNLTA